MQTLIIAVMAAIPIGIWIYIFAKMRPEKKDMLVFAFLAGCCSTGLVILYQKFWGSSVNLIFFEVEPVNFKQSLSEFSTEYFLQKFLVFVFGVGMMEEFVKHFVIRKDKPVGLVIACVLLLVFTTIYSIYHLVFEPFTWNHVLILGASWATFYLFVAVHKRLDFKSIDQVILASIMSALGFAFVENIIYGIRILEMPNQSLASTAMILTIRSIFVVMIHMMCSGIYGYYYGLSLFAGPYLKKHEIEKGQRFFAFEILHKILQFSKKTIFQEEKMLQGLILAMIAHGIYDFILETNLNLSDILGLFGIRGIGFPLYNLVMPLYLVIGYWYLQKLLQEKENHIKFGLVGTEAMPEKDFNELLNTVKTLQVAKKTEEKFIGEGWGSKGELSDLQRQIDYLKKFRLLEDKYVGNQWISIDTLREYQKEVAKIRSSQKSDSLNQKLIQLSSPN